MKSSLNTTTGSFKSNNPNALSKSGNLTSSMSIPIYSTEYEEDEIERPVHEVDYQVVIRLMCNGLMDPLNKGSLCKIGFIDVLMNIKISPSITIVECTCMWLRNPIVIKWSLFRLNNRSLMRGVKSRSLRQSQKTAKITAKIL